jgi:hypothetical protein
LRKSDLPLEGSDKGPPPSRGYRIATRTAWLLVLGIMLLALSG